MSRTEPIICIGITGQDKTNFFQFLWPSKDYFINQTDLVSMCFEIAKLSPAEPSQAKSSRAEANQDKSVTALLFLY